jgi:hypothetical protein
VRCVHVEVVGDGVDEDRRVFGSGRSVGSCGGNVVAAGDRDRHRGAAAAVVTVKLSVTTWPASS